MLMFDDDVATHTSPYYFPDENDCRTCNLCVGNCPTFKVDRTPLESPRGRLKLIKKVLQDDQTLTAEEQHHLNNCVQCRACEHVCPSKMAYGELLESVKVTSSQQQIASPLVRALLYATSDKNRLNQLTTTLRASQQWGLQTLARRLGLFKVAIPEHLDDLLPNIPKPRRFKDVYPAIGERRGAVGLFTGCLTQALDATTLSAGINVLTRLGLDVHIPAAQQCCGGLHQHNGDSATAQQLAAVNIEAFGAISHLDAIVVTASGCGDPLQRYAKTPPDGMSMHQAQQFAEKIMDINQFIAQQPWPETARLEPLTITVAVHEPCSQRFPLGSHRSVYHILERIPGVKLIPLAENHICCGAGGSYMITHPQKSDAIRAAKLAHLDATDAQLLVTSNIGCALHLLAGLNKSKTAVKVAHPVELLAQQLA